MKSPTYRRSIQCLSAALLVAALTGCATAGKFSCPAPDGVSCMSTLELYEHTDGSGAPASNAAVKRWGKRAPASHQGKAAGHQVGAHGDSLVLTAPHQYQIGAVQENALSLGLGQATPQGVMPRAIQEGVALLPARVMRIWMQPWTDQTGDLHMAGYIYSEIADRRWSIGAPVVAPEASRFDPNGPWTPIK